MAPGQFKALLGSIRRKPTNAPDRKSDNEAALAPKTEKTGVMHDIVHGGFKNAKFLAEALPALASGAPLDDKELLLEHGVAMLQKLPLNSGLSSTVSDGFIKMLWNDLPHPSTTAAGPTTRYRRHDGGNNNLWVPEMGKAGSPYARNVPPVKPKGPNMPDPELVFEQLLKRPEGVFKEHPSGLNRLFFSFATIVIHECFQTNRKDQWINETSSYVDLSTLYGNTEKEQVRVRTYQNGTIYPDSIASERIMLMPPGVVALLILFSRNHNSIAQNLFSINEEGKYKPWDSLNEEQKKWQDNDIFQLSRNINVGFFATVVLKDYVAAILNTPRADSTWSLDLGKEIKSGGSRVERGSGNVVSVEFAVLYHWHAALSAADATWMEGLIRENLPELKSLDDMTPELFYKVVMTEGHKLMGTLPKDWTFYNYKRGADGRFNDTELAELIKDCIEEPAHAFGAHGTPASLKVVDIMGQLQARELFNVCTMNEFRQYLNLKPYDSFEAWCEDKDTARAAELLYGHIDNLELYPGLMAECTKPAVPGSGVCPGQTTGRGILDDAVALVRGDRFLSYDFNGNTLTNWGVSKLADIPGGAYGGMLPKLIFSALPASFSGTSSYALLPFYTPKATVGILRDNKVIAKYVTTRPGVNNVATVVSTREGVRQVLNTPASFHPLANEPKLFSQSFFEPGFDAKMASWFSAKTAQLVQESSLKYQGTRRSLDVVRDIANIVPVAWLAERFGIPIKTMKTPRGVLTLPELFSIYVAEYAYQNFNVLPINEWQLRGASERGTPVLKSIVETHLNTQQGFKEKIVDWLEKGSAFELSADADRLYHALNNTKRPVAELVDDCVAFSAPLGAIITQQTALLIDLFLQDNYASYKERLVALAHADDPASTTELQGFVFEGIRHAAFAPGLPRTVAADTVIANGDAGVTKVLKGSRVLVATALAAQDPERFPQPEQLNPHRPAEEYRFLFGSEQYKVIAASIAAVLKGVFRLKNLRRATGRGGRFTTVQHYSAGVLQTFYLDANARESPFPTSLMVEYDDDSVGGVNGFHGANGVNGSVQSSIVHANGNGVKTVPVVATGANGTANGLANGTH